MKFFILEYIPSVDSYTESYGQGELGYLATIFFEYYLPTLKEVLESQKFLIYGYGGNSLRLRPHAGDLVGIGSMFDYEDDEDYQEFFIPRLNLIELLDQWMEIRPNNPSRIFVIKNDEKFYLTTRFPTKYAELHKANRTYKLAQSDDENTELIGKLLEDVLNYNQFLETYKNEPLYTKWNIGNLLVKGIIDHFCILSKTFYIQINRDEFIHLVEQWQKLVEQGPEKIYLILEDGDFRVTDVVPKLIEQ